MHSHKIFLILFLWPTFLFAQETSNCENHPLFNKMPQHKIHNCQEREFDEMSFYQTDKNGSRSELKKGGQYLGVTYNFEGEWANRPSNAQIFQNYINATINAGGKILYKSPSTVCLSLKKSGEQYWVEVSTDGSGIYSVTTIKEASMKQDIVVTADQIQKNITGEGKAIFYGIYFETGKSTLRPESETTIVEISKYLKTNSTVKVYIVGHTDNTGVYESNLKLSTDRAQAIINSLTQAYGISKDRLQAIGVGPVAPIDTNNTETGKAKNRRVEMVLK